MSVLSSRGRGALLAVFFGSLLIVVLGTAPPVHAGTTTDLSLSDATTVCPQLGGTWTAGNSQCYLSPTGVNATSPVYTIQSGDTLRIEAGVLVSWGRGTLYNSGTITNLGSLVPAEGALVSSGTISNLGTFNITITSVFNNTGLVQINSPGVFNLVSGTINNLGTISIYSSFSDLHGAVNNGANGLSAGDIAVFGTLSNYAGGTLFTNYGTITTSGSASLVNFGSLTNKGKISNDGTLTDPSNDLYTGHFTNSYGGTLVNLRTFNNSQGTVIINNGNITNTNLGTLTLSRMATLSSNGIINNQGNFVMNGTLTSGADEPNAAGSILNAGMITVYGGTIDQEGNATFNNLKSGTVELESPIYNTLIALGVLDLENTHYFGMTNSGAINVDSGSKLVVEGAADLDNNGSITVAEGGLLSIHVVGAQYLREGDFPFFTNGTVTNAGAFNTTSVAVNSGIFLNSGVLRVQGSGAELYSAGTITNLNTGTILNQGYLENGYDDPDGNTLLNAHPLINNNGVFNNTGSTDNYGMFVNTKTVNNTGALDIFFGASFSNSGQILNSGKIYNHGSSLGSVINAKGGTIRNGGGSLYNYGDFLNSGTITTDSDGSISNYGTIMSNGTISNGGSFADYCQGSVTSVSGNAPMTSPCTAPTITTTSGETFNVTNPTINGTSDANALIKLTEGYGNVTVGQTTADSDGNWTITVSPLAPGTYTLDAAAFGTDGNSASVSIDVIISPGATTTSIASVASSTKTGNGSTTSASSTTPVTTSTASTVPSTASTTATISSAAISTANSPTTTTGPSSSSEASSSSIPISYLLLVLATVGLILAASVATPKRENKGSPTRYARIALTRPAG